MKYIRIYIIRKLLGLIENIFYEKKLIKFYKKIFFQNSLNHVIDVGVNRGQSIDLFRKINQNVEIYGFEPNPRLFEEAKKELSPIAQSFWMENIRVSNKLLYETLGYKLIYKNYKLGLKNCFLNS